MCDVFQNKQTENYTYWNFLIANIISYSHMLVFKYVLL